MMEPILAEAAPHRGRAVAFAVVLAVIASLAMVPSQHRPRHHRDHPRLVHGKCTHGYVFVVR
jgi:hypothetical protein